MQYTMNAIAIKFHKATTFIGFLIVSTLAQANPVACFNTNMGNFCIELFEAHTPITTANFLSYIESEAYTNGIFHRSIPDFVIQGGGFKIVTNSTGNSIATVNTFAPISNEFRISNTRGTVAMAKLPDNPNSATSQWFVNMKNNSANLDKQNGGFTVFGRVIFNGMDTFDAIEQLSVFNLGSSLPEIPLVDYNGIELLTDNLVMIGQVTVTDTAGVFDENTLSFAVDIGSNTILDVKMQLIETNPSYVFEVDLSNIQTLTTSPTNVATFSTASGELQIPSVMLNATTVVRNVKMRLIDPEIYQFALVSYE